MPFVLASVACVAPAGSAVIKVAWEGDEEALPEGDALELWGGDGAVRLLRRSGRAPLEERAVPGDDLSVLPDASGGCAGGRALAGGRGTRKRRARSARARAVRRSPSGYGGLVHGDVHHQKILRAGEQFVAIDPKPYLADREYDMPSPLWKTGWMIELRRSGALRHSWRRVSMIPDPGVAVNRGAYIRPDLADAIEDVR